MATEQWNVSVEEGKGIHPEFIDPNNYAGSKKIKNRIENHILPLFQRVRDERETLQDRWTRLYNLWRGDPDTKYYDGGVDLHLPLAHKSLETQVAQIKSQSFPQDQNFDVISQFRDNPILALEGEAVEASIKDLIQSEVEQAQLGVEIERFIRNALIYGGSPAKVYWKTKMALNYKLQKMFEGPQQLADFMKQEGVPEYGFRPQNVAVYEGIDFRPVDLFRWFVHPISSQRMEDVEFFFEQVDVTPNWVRSMAKSERNPYGFVNVNKAIKNKGNKTVAMGHLGRDDRLEKEAITIEDDDPPTNKHELIEIWGHFDLYGDGRLIPSQISIINEVVVQVRQNPFIFQEPPYLYFRCVDLADNFYGQGLLELAENTSYIVDALASQATDSVRFQNNHVVIVNRLAVPGPSKLKMAPRAMWYVNGTPREAIDTFVPPDASITAFNTIALLGQNIQDIMGSPPIMQGQVGSKDITATEADLLRAGAMSSVNSLTQRLEVQVLSPLLRRIFQLNQQFRSNSTYIQIAGRPPIPLSPQALALDYNFKWLSSLQSGGRMLEMQTAVMRGQLEQASGESSNSQASPLSGIQAQASLGGGKISPSNSQGGLG